MLYIILSICCSVVVSVMLKLARRYEINVYQAITWNYSAAILLAWIFYKPHWPNLQEAPTITYLILGLLLPLIFLVLAVSVRNNGIVRTDVAQRLSLIISLSGAFFLFGEKFNAIKIIGLALGLVAIGLCIPWHKGRQQRGKNGGTAAYLPLVFAGFGAIDILFRMVSGYKAVPYTSSLFVVFVISFVFALLGLIYLIATKKTRFSWPHIFFGWLLGIFNFANILFYLKALGTFSNRPSVVFSGMNLGVIILGLLIGTIVFKEKLTLLNKIGIGLAVIAIMVIAFSKYAV